MEHRATSHRLIPDGQSESPGLVARFIQGELEQAMEAEKQLVPNVAKFLESASSQVGKMLAERFHIDLFTYIVEQEVTSPIEQLFLIALRAIAESEFIPVDVGPDIGPDGKVLWGAGLYIAPQASVGKYRVDFLLRHEVGKGPTKPQQVVVELDGHDFHDKDKRQRSYEKARDRALVRAGFKVIHFTGSDVTKDPFAVAHEALELLGAVDAELFPFDPKNPLGEF